MDRYCTSHCKGMQGKMANTAEMVERVELVTSSGHHAPIAMKRQ